MKRKIVVFAAFLLVKVCMADYVGIYVSSAHYYDSDADGFIDSVILNFSGSVLESDLPAFLKLLDMPTWRNFTVRQSRLLSEKAIEILVRENSDRPVTSVSGQDLFRTREGKLPGGGEVRTNSFMARDHLSPVIVSANLISYTGLVDSLIVVFSERINAFSASEPFSFRTPDGQTYSVSFSGSSFETDTYTGEVSGGDIGVIKQGDSVWIRPQAQISDPLYNVQTNSANRRTEIDATVINDALTFTNAYYYDRDADGFIDSIVIACRGELSGSDLEVLNDLIVLPSERNFTLENISFSSGNLILTVHEGSTEPRTSVFSTDVISIKRGIIPGKGLVGAMAISVQDRVAPVLLSAHVETHEVGDDTLFMDFSENISRVTPGEPFIFHNGNTRYQVILSTISLRSHQYMGRILSVDGEMNAGDSVWINASVNTSDLAGNEQSNSSNRRVFLTVNNLDIPVEFASAAYFDDDADGFVDRINIEFSGPVSSTDLERISELIQFPSARNFQVRSFSQHNTTIIVRVVERRNQPNTAVTADDRIRIVSGRTPGGGLLVEKTIPVSASMAPVLLSAHLDWFGEGRDSLRLVFSEPVKSTSSQRPALFRKPGDWIYEVVITNSRVIESRLSGLVVSVSDNSGMRIGDSVWINTEARISDNQDNVQLNALNRRVLLTMETHLSLRVMAENNPFTEGRRPMPEIVKSIYARKGLVAPADGMVIVAEPDRVFRESLDLEGTVSIYDVVHNPVIQKKKMLFDSGKNRLYFVWDGNNYNGRKTGTGTYLAIVKVKDKSGKEITRQLNLGIKR